MSFIDQVAKSFGDMPEMKFQAVLFGRDAFYIEGARPIKISAEEMMFKAPNALICVCGSDMTVKELSGDCMSVVGKISGFEVKDV